jgi:uncharacterized protein (DUF736 family)
MKDWSRQAGTLRTLTLNVKVKFVPNDKGSENASDYRIQAVNGLEKGQSGRAALHIGGARRSVVSRNGLCPPDRR